VQVNYKPGQTIEDMVRQPVVLTRETEFSGTCACGRACRHRPLPGGYAPKLPVMNVTCGGCGAAVTLAADGSSFAVVRARHLGEGELGPVAVAHLLIVDAQGGGGPLQ
jgi:hypothetical protein